MTAIEALNKELERLHQTLRQNCDTFAEYHGVMIPIGSIQSEIKRLTDVLIEIAKMEAVK